MSLQNLDQYQRLISVEALSVHKPDAKTISRLINYFSGVQDFIGGAVSGLGTNGKYKYMDVSKLIKVLKPITYDDLSEVPLPTPAGLSATYIDYINVLSKAQYFTNSLYDDVLMPFNRWVADCLNDPKKLESVRNNIGVKLHDLSGIKEDLKGCLKNGEAGVNKYGRLLQRNADWDTIGKNMNSVLTTQKKLNNERIQSTVNTITDNVNILIGRLNDPNEPYPISSKNLAELSRVCYEMAIEVEFYALIDYQIRAADTALSDGIEGLIKNYK